MRFDDRFLEELKSRLRPSDVVGKTVKLRRQGREYAGLSPFTKEKSPSFFVNDDKGFYHCFSSGKHGDIISFLQETERLTFSEAVERLAAEAGMSLPEPDARAAQDDRKRAGLGDWMELAAAWFEAELRRPVGKDARAYLDRRALPEDQWSRFRIGFAPNGRTALKDYLVAKGAKPGDLVEAGLLIAPEDGGAPYDRFRDRIIFPITDTRGKVVSFGGRAMDPNARAKYLNGPETSLFHKSRVLYGLYDARKLLHAAQAAAPNEQTPLLVVEGYMDVVACQRANLAAVAAMGTALTEEQMEALWRLHPEPTLCFDGDKAGQRAASRAIDRALPLLKPGRSFRFSIVSGGKDPDDVLREQGPAALKAQVTQTTPFVEALFVRERDLEPLDTPERKAGLKQRLRAAAGTIADKDLASAYKDDLYAKLDLLFPKPAYGGGGGGGQGGDRPFTPRNGGGGGGGNWRGRDRGPPDPGIRGIAREQIGRRLNPFHAAVAIAAVNHPAWARPYDEALERIGFGEARLKGLAHEIFEALIDDIGDETPFRDILVRKGRAEELAELDRLAATLNAPFLDAKMERERARVLWASCYEAIVEVGDAERALRAMREEPVTAASLTATRDLRDRIAILERQISNLEFWQPAH
ncbi:DNA primase [Caulobacter sp. D4A]|uniref:DNA primase n=1 Tax=unclassified Caulobacter TaxID=2648921 RepID=UPI000D73DDC8|nr:MULTISPECIES: DNA primase [unclassified Caulobacter]PXA79691.1 DNA primase [Caulobacter sp. D4A]PXA89939.1 DNA primase [Caulobacter sp. D5]